MGLKPDLVIRRYEKLASRNSEDLLKTFLLKLMFHNFNVDRKLASSCSEILSAIDAGSVAELTDEPLALLGKYLQRS